MPFPLQNVEVFEPFEVAYIRNLIEDEVNHMPPEDYRTNVAAYGQLRYYAILLIRSTWRYAQGLGDPFVPFLALTYFDRTISRLPSPLHELKFNVFVETCIIVAHEQRTAGFNVAHYLEILSRTELWIAEITAMRSTLIPMLGEIFEPITALSYLNYLIFRMSGVLPLHIDLGSLRTRVRNRLPRMYFVFGTLNFRPSVIACCAFLAELEISPIPPRIVRSIEHVILTDQRFDADAIILCRENNTPREAIEGEENGEEADDEYSEDDGDD